VNAITPHHHLPVAERGMEAVGGREVLVRLSKPSLTQHLWFGRILLLLA
jgi:hypothetical protein